VKIAVQGVGCSGWRRHQYETKLTGNFLISSKHASACVPIRNTFLLVYINTYQRVSLHYASRFSVYTGRNNKEKGQNTSRTGIKLSFESLKIVSFDSDHFNMRWNRTPCREQGNKESYKMSPQGRGGAGAPDLRTAWRGFIGVTAAFTCTGKGILIV
jgi:hypothetical protein